MGLFTFSNASKDDSLHLFHPFLGSFVNNDDVTLLVLIWGTEQDKNAIMLFPG